MKTKNELEQMLPDYVFGRLDDVNKNEFEKCVTEFPELIKEINDVKSVFSKVDKMDLDRILDHKTKNLSVKVNQKLYNKSKVGGNSFLFRYALPVAVVITVAMIYYQNTFKDNTHIDNAKFSNILNNSIDNFDFSLIDSTDTSLSIYSDVASIEPDLDDSDYILNMIGFSSEDSDILNKSSFVNPSQTELFFYEKIESITENEFQTLLEDLNDVKM